MNLSGHCWLAIVIGLYFSASLQGKLQAHSRGTMALIVRLSTQAKTVTLLSLSFGSTPSWMPC